METILVSNSEMNKIRKWVEEKFTAKQNGTNSFFSFTYDGDSSENLLKKWQKESSNDKTADRYTEWKLKYIDPDTKLEVRCIATEYHDYPVVEWTLYFKNTGSADSLILENIKSLDIQLEAEEKKKFVLHHNRGDGKLQASYEPLTKDFNPGEELRFTPFGGRPTHTQFPYYNLQYGDEGVIIVLGWPGQWSMEFAKDHAYKIQVKGGQELTRLKLLPGEEIRTPLVVMQFWNGDRIRAQNTWRRWMVTHNLPKPGGKLFDPHTASFTGNFFTNLIISDKGEKQFIDRYYAEKIIPDFWWIDAGWYKCGDSWEITGTWETDEERFPDGLRGLFNYANQKSISKSVVWFEPERVTQDTWLYKNHPEWLLKINKTILKKELFLLNLGVLEARKWLVNQIDKMITEEGIDIYRQDFNVMNPIETWRSNDPEDRQGITEIKYISGYLAFWDELLSRHPNLLIDSCASGGCRNDLETLRRSLPLWRSDYAVKWEPIGMQGQTYGLASWIPYYGTGVGTDDNYSVRSSMTPFMLMCWDMRRKDLNYDNLRSLVEEWRQIAHCFIGDYYPLTPYSLDNQLWMAWQFNCPEKGEGIVQVFRRAESPFESARFKLRELDAEDIYTIRNFDTVSDYEMVGHELMEDGLPVELTERPAALIIKYQRRIE